MTIDRDDLLNSILASIDRIHNVKSEDMPNIELYMDQVTTYMENCLKSTTRNPGDDKILTKTMINNYAKNDLLPPPKNKKYSKEHLIVLFLIYYSKGFLSITDIQNMLGPLTDRYFDTDSDIDLCKIYDEIFSMEKERTEVLKEDIVKKYKKAGETFSEVEGEDKEILTLFSFIFMLGYDVYVKKLLVEKLLDEFTLFSDADQHEKKKGKNKRKKD